MSQMNALRQDYDSNHAGIASRPDRNTQVRAPAPSAVPVSGVVTLDGVSMHSTPSPARQQQLDLERAVLRSLSGRVAAGSGRSRGRVGMAKGAMIALGVSIAVWMTVAGTIMMIA